MPTRTKKPRKIEAYRHPPAQSEQVADVTPPDPDGDPTRWRERPCFYVSVKDGQKFGLLAGPFRTHQEAIDAKPAAWAMAEQVDPWAAFYSFGTVKMKDGSRLGVLNDKLGIEVK